MLQSDGASCSNIPEGILDHLLEHFTVYSCLDSFDQPMATKTVRNSVHISCMPYLYATAFSTPTNSRLQAGWWISISRSSLDLPVSMGVSPQLKTLLTFRLENQITPFNFTTPDHETIYAWHVMPLGLYAKHEAEIIQRPAGCVEDITKTKAFKLLRDDPDSRLIINCEKSHNYQWLDTTNMI